MLYFLTGRNQTGKTRWLQMVIAALCEHGVPCLGVIAPGVWRFVDGVYRKEGITNVLLPGDRQVLFAKPVSNCPGGSQRTRLKWTLLDNAVAEVNAHFSGLIASRHEVALGLRMRGEVQSGANGEATCQHGGRTDQNKGRTDQYSDSAGQHGGRTDQNKGRTDQYGGSADQHEGRTDQHGGRTDQYGGVWRRSSGVLVVDEIGPFELLHKAGLTEAIRMLELGSCSLVDHAIVVVRESLLSTVLGRFDKWGTATVIRPDVASWGEVKNIWQNSEGSAF